MTDTKRTNDPGSLVGGLILIGVGTLFLLDRLRISDFGDMIRIYWPMILVLVGLPKLFQRRSMWSGLWLIALGFWLQVVHLHLFGLTYRNSWPLLLIALGAGITLRALTDSLPRASKEQHHER